MILIERLDHLVLTVRSLEDTCTFYERVLGMEVVPFVAIEEGPVERTGALGPMESLYIRDPDRNLIELCTYPMSAQQPTRAS